MFLLDTNVISELRKVEAGRADPMVAQWSRRHEVSQLYMSVITLHELEYGILRVERRDPKQAGILRDWLFGSVLTALQDRIIQVDAPVAATAAKFRIPDPRPLADALIAATALVHGLTVVTRNVADFQGLPVSVVNPWLA